MAATGTTGDVSLHASFARRATGFVRDVRLADALVFNTLPAAPGIVLAVSMFWILSLFSGVNIYICLLITAVCAFLISGAWGLLSEVMPRSGGEYVIASRSLHPTAGFATSCLIGASSMIALGYWGIFAIQIGIGPMLTMIGVATDTNGLVTAGSKISTTPWNFIIGVGLVLILTGIMILGTRLMMRLQTWLFWIGMLGLTVAGLALLFTSRSNFIRSYNDYARPFTKQPDTYHFFIQKAQEAGVSVGGGINWKNTLFASGAFIAFGVWNWYHSIIGGEVRQAGTKKGWYTMIGALFLTFVPLALMTALLYRTVGQGFMTAVNGVSGNPDVYTLPNAPWWITLVAAAHPNTLFVIFLGITFMTWGPLITYLQIVQPVRALFAWAFDRVIPEKIAAVNERTHTPVVALILIGLGGIPFLAAAAYTKGFFTWVALSTIVGFPAFVIIGVSAIVFPRRNRAAYEASSANINVGGIPLMSIFGVGAILAASFGAYLWLTQAKLGLPNADKGIWKQLFNSPGNGGLALVATCIIIGALIYYAGKTWRRSQGIDISLNYLEIPPE
jgi:APA family basic amino acid/polyamine antiporter